MQHTIKQVLVIRFSAMGDVAIMVPVLRAFTNQYPDIKITVLTRPFFAVFFKDLNNVSVFPVDLKGRHKGLLGLYKLASDLNNYRHFDAIADLHDVLRTKILKQFIKSPFFVSIDKGRKLKKALISGTFFKPLKSTHTRYADVFKTLGLPINLSNPIFPDKQILNKKLQTLIETDSKKIIGIAPFAAHEAKMYPIDLMKNVIEALSKEYKVLLFGGGKKEIETLQTLENSFENVVSVAGKISLKEELAIISNLDIMLSMDSGNGHIAAMLGVKVITIWGVTHPFLGFAPFHQPESFALLSDRSKFPKIPTSVYGNKYPKNYKEASRSILPQTVVSKIKATI